MGIEPSSYCPDVIEIANDKYGDRPKPSKWQASMSESRCQLLPLARALWRSARAHIRILGKFRAKTRNSKWADRKL